MQVTPAFYKLDGTTVTGEPVLIKAAEIRYVDFKKLLPPGHRNERDWGGLSLFYYGVAREMWAQYRLLGVNGGGNADEFFIVRSEQRAEVQEAAWWMPNGSTAILALGNITDAATGATVSFGNGDTQTIDLAPHGTQVIRHEHSAKTGTESVKIEFAGAPGSIIPTGVITSQDGTFNSVIRFYDTKGAKQSHLFANGFRLGGVTPHMVLKNTSASALTAQPKFLASGGVSADPVSLPDVSLAPGETKEIDLATLLQAAGSRPDLDVVSVQVANSGAPGTLIGSLYGVNNSTGVNYDTPLRDSGPVRTMTGSYPWKVSKDFTTVVYITNITDEQAEFVGEINYSGNHFLLDARKLAPGETARIDLREVQAKQEVNREGQKMSKGFSQGQFKWAARGDTKGKIVLIGRAEMVSLSQRVSTNYSCNDPCPPSYEGSIDPFLPPVVFVNLSGGSAAWETVCYSWGTCYGPYSVYASWTLDNQVGSLSPNNGTSTTMTGTTSGYATLDGFIGIQSTYSYDGRDCYYNNSYNEGGQTPVEVAAVGKIQYQSGSNFVDISGTLYVLKGTSVTFKAVPDPTDATFESGKPVWSGSSGATGTGETKSVTFNTKSSSTSDFKAVVATAGNSMTVNVIVYELVNTFAPLDNFTGMSLTSYGLAEVVNLAFMASPTVTATQAGGLQWKIAGSGGGSLTGVATDGQGHLQRAGHSPICQPATGSPRRPIQRSTRYEQYQHRRPEQGIYGAGAWDGNTAHDGSRGCRF